MLERTTLIPTPSGYRAIVDLTIGDNVYGQGGSVAIVSGRSDVISTPGFEFEFRSGEKVLCGGKQAWWCYPVAPHERYNIFNTSYMIRNLRYRNGKSNYLIDACDVEIESPPYRKVIELFEVKNIRPLGKNIECVSIEVDTDDHLFLIGKQFIPCADSVFN